MKHAGPAAAAFACGLLFGLGLIVSGMYNPRKVLDFLDVAAIPAGRWDPSLAFVMAGAVPVAFLGYRMVFRRGAPMLGREFVLPQKTMPDRALVLGAVLFGLGWGLSGFCPGPAVVAAGTGLPGALLFGAAMLGGMAAARRYVSYKAAHSQ